MSEINFYLFKYSLTFITFNAYSFWQIVIFKIVPKFPLPNNEDGSFKAFYSKGEIILFIYKIIKYL